MCCQIRLLPDPTANGSFVQVYCDMEGTNCGGEGGWMRVAHLDTTEPSSQCPVGFRLESSNNKNFCIRDTSSGGCRSMHFETFTLTYSQVCGNVWGYSRGSPEALFTSLVVPLSGGYVDGVSITYGTAPNHIWTYASGCQEQITSTTTATCPCNSPFPGRSPPSYVGTDYYCESGSRNNPNNSPIMWHTNDPLWDGMQYVLLIQAFYPTSISWCKQHKITHIRVLVIHKLL